MIAKKIKSLPLCNTNIGDVICPRKFGKSLFFSIALMLAVSCEYEGIFYDEPDKITESYEEPYIISNFRSIAFANLPGNMEPGNVEIEISANINWAVSIIQTGQWITVAPIEGNGDGTIIVSVDANPEFFDRTAQIVISGEGVETVTIQVFQMSGFDILPFVVDPVFRQFCIDEFDINKDGLISTKEAGMVEKIDVKRMQISTLEGIEYFPNLLELDCSSNSIEYLDISKNTKLIELNCTNNNIENLSLVENKALKRIRCSYNSLVHLDVGGLTELVELEVFFADIGIIDVSTNINLISLGITGNKITSIDLTNNKQLRELYCSENLLTALDVSNNTELMILFCDYNPFIGGAIDISNNTHLLQFSCRGNGFTSLNLSNNINLERLFCNDNLLTTLDLTQNISLYQLSAVNNNLTGVLDISKIELRNLTINLSQNQNLTIIEVPPGFIEFAKDNPHILKDDVATWVEKPDFPNFKGRTIFISQ